MKLVVFGTGNIATFYTERFAQAGIIPVQVISRDEAKAKAFAEMYQCAYTTDPKHPDPDADIYLLAFKDDALISLASSLHLPGKLIVFPAGAIALSEFAHVSEHVACLWPLFSVRKEHLPVGKSIPVVVNASNAEANEQALKLAHLLTDAIFPLNDQQRSVAHLAAVFANNFTNHLYTLTQAILKQEGIPFSLMLPIIQSTTAKLLQGSPDQYQTGPAIRRDIKTISRHEEMLSGHADALAIYQIMTLAIQSYYAEEGK
ncbi:MAG: DUF2520 domain-containing protein [Chitinophagaceae bacterium]|nr:DUF2520 domain-containing protein [Chitinophagaceae bacterium]